MVKMEILGSRSEWLEKRSSYIGGSDAASVIGLNPWRSNVELWEIKTGRRTAPDISDLDVVKYGTKAEEHLRELFKLDFPEYKVEYVENNIWFNDKFPWAHASLDGWIHDSEGRFGILEIKTSNIMKAEQMDKWKDRIPDNYYIQVLHYMMVTGAEFAFLKAQLKRNLIASEPWAITKHYKIERKDVEEDIEYLINAEREFCESIKEDKQPALILPDV